jgi:TM2 domain-containing membrane protein YozV
MIDPGYKRDMNARTLSLLLLCGMLFNVDLAAQWRQAPDRSNADTTLSSTTSAQTSAWTSRKTTAIILSALVPGSGQSYLGHTTKGAAFTLATVGSAIITTLSSVNVTGRNERMQELSTQYALAQKFDSAAYYWNKILEVKSLADEDAKRRSTFAMITAAFWTLNIVDMIFFTDDFGEQSFGSVDLGRGTTVAVTPDRRNLLNARFIMKF